LKNRTTRGLCIIKMYCLSKAWLTQMLKTKKQCQQTYVNKICKSIRAVTILIIFALVRRRMVSPEKVHVQTTWNFRLQKLHKQLSNSWHRSNKEHAWNWIVSFCNVFSQECMVYILKLIFEVELNFV
jgi:hypothetical protein